MKIVQGWQNRIAHIHLFLEEDEFEYHINYLDVEKETEDGYILVEEDEDSEEDIPRPRGDFLYKEVNEDAASDGYSSLNMPEYVRVDEHVVRGSIYVRETEIEQGKENIKKELHEELDRIMQRYKEIEKILTS